MAGQSQRRPYRRLKSERDCKTLMARYYAVSQTAPKLGLPTAWLTSGAPVEVPLSMGIIPQYPENFGALCGARKVGPELCQVAEDHGYSPDLCSYARNDIGSVLAPDKAPLGGLAKPDLLIGCNNICGTVTKWWEHLAHHLNLPLFMLDTPFVADAEPEPHMVDYAATQVGELAEFLQKHTRKRFNERRFRKVAERSARTVKLWNECLDLCTARPSPLNGADRFLAMAPVVALRGTRFAERYYIKLKREVTDRVARGVGAVRDERHRLLWDNIAIWFDIFGFFNRFAEHGVSFPVDTYTSIWCSNGFGDEPDWTRGVARAYADIYLNRGMETKLATMERMIRRHELDGFVLHSNRSCKPYSLGQLVIKDELTRRTGKPGLVIEADMVDQRLYDQARVQNQIDAFLEML